MMSITDVVRTGRGTASDHAVDVLSHLPAISLDDLNARASLQTRVDRKYVVPVADLPGVLGDLGPDTRALEIDGARGSHYESVYFDTADLTSYRAAAQRRRRRFKIRTRSYVDTAQCYLEVKTRGGRSLTVKERIEHPFSAPDLLTSDGLDYIDAALAESGICSVDPTELQAMLITSYTRTTLFLPSSDSRATVDLSLDWSGIGGDRILTPNIAVVETKSGSTPSAVDHILWRHGHRPSNISKYGVGMAALHPDLPQNKWRRVLDRHLLPDVVRPTSFPSSTTRSTS
ncbi:polyphosphate polymerase domain-containing protein [Mycetocola zhadangensis]|uniref:polyphosphate polymerase domain-containing protein n=1 Tax=Mycetocola zhadangensis TaxID=1164595 RepID=UPI003A4E118C